MTRTIFLQSVGLGLLVIGGQLDAQVSPGSSLRILADSQYEGTLVRAEGSQLVLVRGAGRDTVRVPLTDVRAIAVWQQRGTALREGALIGAFLGMVAGAYIGARSYTNKCPRETLACVDLVGAEARTVEGAGFGGLAGALAGGVIGALIPTGGKWVTLAPQGRGLGLQFS